MKKKKRIIPSKDTTAEIWNDYDTSKDSEAYTAKSEHNARDKQYLDRLEEIFGDTKF